MVDDERLGGSAREGVDRARCRRRVRLAALNQLWLASAFGSGVRSEAAFAELVARAGLSVRELTDIGWDHRLWVLARQG
ncbi:MULTISPECIES: hypothetical protein [unclassified Streptomyces]|uniref:hypothetical protein n=1 Tax=unclassified Streptomyces TaxID=2593676 RepID=UPI002270ABC8|nr:MULTISPECIES: hypothetical protein [unclassified Streptomyces]MCY0921530.1 hypothetical protein [Streptomyces sp. H27-G5]MCY0960459.1 hypothetical protein [Streptomyces sp. H27-H5]